MRGVITPARHSNNELMGIGSENIDGTINLRQRLETAWKRANYLSGIMK